jgi:hypothetical protein
MLENEEWREIEEFPHYRISNYGRVKHVSRDRARKVTINERGFPVILLSSATSPTRYLRQINVLVANAFLRPPTLDEDNSVWHIDGDLTNCRPENLRWDMRSRVLEWNEMHRRGGPRLNTPRVRNNRTGEVYEDAYECAIAEGKLESDIAWRVEKQARSMEDDSARYRYLFKDED